MVRERATARWLDIQGFPLSHFVCLFVCLLFSLFPFFSNFKFKVMKLGVSGEARASGATGGKLWSSQMVFLAKEGNRLSSMAAVKEFMEKSPKYNFDDLTNFRAFLREDGTTPEELRNQIQRSVEVAPWGLKKYKSNQKPGSRLLSQKPNQNLSTTSFIEDEWSEEEDEANIPYDDDSDEEVKDEDKMVRKAKKDYEPFVFEMRPTKAGKELRMELKMLTLARRPFKLILNENPKSTNDEESQHQNEDTLVSSDRKRKLDLAQNYPELKIEYARESEMIKNIVKSKRQRSSRHIG